MNKELCFILENKNVYLDHILVDYEYVPIFLLCKDDECQYYLALCTNIENGEYIVVKISLLSVYNLLHGNIAMRDVILNQKMFWKVVSGDEIKNDIINQYPINHINDQDLPEKDVKFKILQKHIKEYVQKFDKEFLHWNNIIKKSGGEKYFKLLALTSDSTNATVDQSKGIVTFKIGPEETKIAKDTTNENGEVKLCKRK